MNQPGYKSVRPWNLTFSYGRALQGSVVTAWAGKKENVKAAQAQLLKNSERNSKAAKGEYLGGEGSNKSAFEAGRIY